MSEIAVHVPENVRDGLKYMLWTGCGMARKNEVDSCGVLSFIIFQVCGRGLQDWQRHPAKGPKKTSSVSSVRFYGTRFVRRLTHLLSSR